MEKEQKLEVLQDLIQMETVNDNEDEAAQYIKDLLKEYDIDAEVIEHEENRSSLVAETKGSEEGKTLALSGHFDVVDPGNEKDWSHDPFGGEIEDGKLYGRGTADMKAGVAAAVIAMIELKEEEADFDGTIRFLGTAGEEVGMIGSSELAQKGYADDVDALILPEPSVEDELHFTHKGTLNYTVTSKGRAAHSSSPESGINAIQGLNDYINLATEEMRKITDEYENEDLGKLYHSFTVIEGGNQVNSIPESASAEINVRTIPEYHNEKVIGKVEEMIQHVNENFDGHLEIEVTQNSYPVASEPDSELIKAAQEVLGDRPVTGMKPVTDASNFAEKNDFDLLVSGPGVSEQAHVVDEHVEVDHYLTYIDEMKKIALTYLNN